MRIANVSSVEFDALCLHRRRRFRSGNDLRSRVFPIFVAMLMTLACGTPHATLDIASPSSATAGTPFTIAVTTIYEGQRDTVINSVLHFTSSDSAAILPHDYIFRSSDAGSHTFTNGVTLKTPGNQTITATILMATGINGTVNVMVSGASITSSE